MPVKMVHNKISKFAITTSNIFKTHADSLVNHVDNFAQQFVDYAKTLIGTPYSWGSVNPEVGVDCSGFVTYVSGHFGINVPRTSAQFAHLGMAVKPAEAKTGDIILFTGSNPRKHVVGHMGIVTDNPDGNVSFIHSSSGHKRGVHISELSGYYKKRLVKIIRIFPLNENNIVSQQKVV
jgi:lipoprotein Spr